MIRITEEGVGLLAEIMVDKVISGNSFVERIVPLRVKIVKRVAHLGVKVKMMARLLVILEVLSTK